VFFAQLPQFLNASFDIGRVQAAFFYEFDLNSFSICEGQQQNKMKPTARTPRQYLHRYIHHSCMLLVLLLKYVTYLTYMICCDNQIVLAIFTLVEPLDFTTVIYHTLFSV